MIVGAHRGAGARWCWVLGGISLRDQESCKQSDDEKTVRRIYINSEVRRSKIGKSSGDNIGHVEFIVVETDKTFRRIKHTILQYSIETAALISTVESDCGCFWRLHRLLLTKDHIQIHRYYSDAWRSRPANQLQVPLYVWENSQKSASTTSV